MPNWRKVITSGSNAILNSVTASAGITVDNYFKMTNPAQSTIQFDAASGGTGGISYKDSGNGQRYGLLFAGSNVVALANRASNGVVQIRANTSTAGSGGELTVAQFEDNIITLYKDTKITGSLAVGNISPNATDGRIDASNDIVAYSSSDIRWKENIKPIENALEKVSQINGVEFDWKELTEEEKKTQHSNEGHDVGVIAQEIEKVLPEVVTTRENGYKGVKYDKIVALLIESIKDLKAEIEELKNKIG